jgi:hypothetical protein
MNEVIVYKKQSNTLKRLLVPIQRLRPLEVEESEEW